MADSIKEIKKFINKRPKVAAAYGYGSGLFKQTGYIKKDRPQIDLILVVDDIKKWHQENIKLNPKDYTFLGKMFFKLASSKRLKGITGITYLSNITEDNRIYKYGTIEKKDLIYYLDTWESFYLPGRFQKTNLPIIENNDIQNINIKNRESALFVGLLLSKENSSLIDIYTKICSLSFLGDTRMRFAENPRKVLNIVEGSYDIFKEIYGTENKYFKLNKKEKATINYKKLLSDINTLPSNLLNYIGDIDMNNTESIRSKILEYFTNLNKKESTKQTLKGIFTNGIVRSIKYASKKVLKKIKYNKKK